MIQFESYGFDKYCTDVGAEPSFSNPVGDGSYGEQRARAGMSDGTRHGARAQALLGI